MMRFSSFLNLVVIASMIVSAVNGDCNGCTKDGCECEFPHGKNCDQSKCIEIPPSCPMGGCNQDGTHSPSCCGGYCSQMNAKAPGCQGGGCAQDGTEYPTCQNGKCSQIETQNPTCQGGSCDQSGRSVDPKCQGGKCDQREASGTGYCQAGNCNMKGASLMDCQAGSCCFGGDTGGCQGSGCSLDAASCSTTKCGGEECPTTLPADNQGCNPNGFFSSTTVTTTTVNGSEEEVRTESDGTETNNFSTSASVPGLFATMIAKIMTMTIVAYFL